METRVQAVQWDVEAWVGLEICKVKGRAGTVTGRAGGTVTGRVGMVAGSIVMMGGSRVGMVRGSRVGMVAGRVGTVTGMRGVGMVAGRAGTVIGRRGAGLIRHCLSVGGAAVSVVHHSPGCSRVARPRQHGRVDY